MNSWTNISQLTFKINRVHCSMCSRFTCATLPWSNLTRHLQPQPHLLIAALRLSESDSDLEPMPTYFASYGIMTYIPCLMTNLCVPFPNTTHSAHSLDKIISNSQKITHVNKQGTVLFALNCFTHWFLKMICMRLIILKIGSLDVLQVHASVGAVYAQEG
jgi:hypothetical protein